METKLKYFIGGDVHSSTTTLAVLDRENQLVDSRTIPTQEGALREYLRGLPSPKGLVMEESEFAQWLYTVLVLEVDELVICDPYRNYLLKEGAKTDRIDARKLASLYHSGLVKPVFHRVDKRMDLRRLVSCYRETIDALVRVKNQSQALDRKCGKKEKNFSSIDQTVRTIQQERLASLLVHRDRLIQEFEHFSKKVSEIIWLRSIPGIGLIGAVKIAASVIEPKRFLNKHKWWSYCGLVKHGRHSGGKCYGYQSTRANRELKSVFKTAAVTVLRGKGPMQSYYQSFLAKGLSERHAQNALARKIAAISLSCWKQKRKFDPNFERRKNKKSETIH